MKPQKQEGPGPLGAVVPWKQKNCWKIMH